MDQRVCPEEGPMVSPVEPHVLSPNRTDRLRLWEIDPVFRCPVVGMCLSLSEQKKILKKSGISTKGQTPFRVHEVLVGGGDKENVLSRKANSLLDHKYRSAIDRLMELDETAFVEQWNGKERPLSGSRPRRRSSSGIWPEQIAVNHPAPLLICVASGS